jgi:hypothetical protein
MTRDTAHPHACLHECPLLASAILKLQGGAYLGSLPAAMRSSAPALAAADTLMHDSTHLHTCLHERPWMASADHEPYKEHTLGRCRRPYALELQAFPQLAH